MAVWDSFEAGGHLIAFRGQDGIEFQPRFDFHGDFLLPDNPGRFWPEGMEGVEINRVEIIGPIPACRQTVSSLC
jgi:hypothetical protein